MRIFLYEFLTGGGWWHTAEAPPARSLLVEGQAMARALAADLAALPTIHVVTTLDSRQPAFHPPACEVCRIGSANAEREAITSLAASADATILIAPETGGALLDRARWVEAVGGRLLSPTADFIAITGNKSRTAAHLRANGIPVPKGYSLPPVIAMREATLHPREEFAASIPFPAVLKPLDGCGSQGVQVLHTQDALDLAQKQAAAPLRLEPFVPGLPASVSLLCGPRERVALPACEQRLSPDSRFAYLGGSTPLAPILADRARRLALAAVEALPPTTGYVGVDLILGDAADGSGDVVIEVNPRLTTSYVGLRAACRGNLAAGMLAIARGEGARLSFDPGPLEYDPDGAVRRREAKASGRQG